jgi:hypothetical protein
VYPTGQPRGLRRGRHAAGRCNLDALATADPHLLDLVDAEGGPLAGWRRCPLAEM